MASRVSASVSTALAAIEHAPGTTSAPATLRLTFPQPDGAAAAVVASDNAGLALTPLEAKNEPALALSATAARAAAPGQKFVAASIDLDAPFPSFPIMGPVLHGMQTDLTADLAGADDSGWVPLVSPVSPLAGYVKPGPPPPSACHRYVFLVWRQPDGLDKAGIAAKMGWPAAGAGLLSRVRFDMNRLEQTLGLGEIVGINYFTSQHGSK